MLEMLMITFCLEDRNISNKVSKWQNLYLAKRKILALIKQALVLGNRGLVFRQFRFHSPVTMQKSITTYRKQGECFKSQTASCAIKWSINLKFIFGLPSSAALIKVNFSTTKTASPRFFLRQPLYIKPLFYAALKPLRVFK